jgi:pyruvate/2-oxoacid:ferredoxin oxidoreductase alpha subunit
MITPLTQKKTKVITGNHAISYGALRSRVQVISAYPITPQTQVVELLSELCANRTLAAKFIKVESEHSAMAALIGAAGAGARSFTATSSQGLALMHEMLHWAAGARLPIVMANINRSLGAPWSIWTEQTDSLAQRDTGWMQLYCESNQEALDSVIQAYKVSEKLLLPTMLVLDAFFLSHTAEPVEIPDPDVVDSYLPSYRPTYKLDVNDPHAFGGLASPDVYMELRYRAQQAMAEAVAQWQDADREFYERFGRCYGLIEPYRLDDAELALITSGTVTSTAREAIDELREQGQRVGLLKIRLFRPFPVQLLRQALAQVSTLAVIDRNISLGAGGIFGQEVRAALYNDPRFKNKPVFGFVVGLGGRDVTPATIREIVNYVQTHDAPEDLIWIGVKP